MKAQNLQVQPQLILLPQWQLKFLLKVKNEPKSTKSPIKKDRVEEKIEKENLAKVSDKIQIDEPKKRRVILDSSDEEDIQPGKFFDVVWWPQTG